MALVSFPPYKFAWLPHQHFWWKNLKPYQNWHLSMFCYSHWFSS